MLLFEIADVMIARENRRKDSPERISGDLENDILYTLYCIMSEKRSTSPICRLPCQITLHVRPA